MRKFLPCRCVKNLIFASNGYKPEIVLDDALSNHIKIVKNAGSCLVYDCQIKPAGLSWIELVAWWADKNGKEKNQKLALELKERLFDSLASPPERVLFETYFKTMVKPMHQSLPALIPQVYLHYDPYSIKKYGIRYLLRQRMDFLLLLPGSARIVIEVDGKQHYSEENMVAPAKYAEMVSLDRELKLLGYEVYRFGGYELTQDNEGIIADFFHKLFAKHKILE